LNNAGTEGQVGPITDQTAESFAATFDTNVLGVILSIGFLSGCRRGSAIAFFMPSSRTFRDGQVIHEKTTVPCV
jgi:NAD(P)-dependent dehydrogenase (short-subunit alcohol dehydrogenase family)